MQAKIVVNKTQVKAKFKQKFSSDDDDAPLIKKKKKGKYSRSFRDDDPSADEPVFASIWKRTSAESGFAKVKSNSLTHYLNPSMLLSVGPIDVCTVGKNNIRQMMIK